LVGKYLIVEAPTWPKYPVEQIILILSISNGEDFLFYFFLKIIIRISKLNGKGLLKTSNNIF
jgi:hypothetical protein